MGLHSGQVTLPATRSKGVLSNAGAMRAPRSGSSAGRSMERKRAGGRRRARRVHGGRTPAAGYFRCSGNKLERPNNMAPSTERCALPDAGQNRDTGKNRNRQTAVTEPTCKLISSNTTRVPHHRKSVISMVPHAAGLHFCRRRCLVWLKTVIQSRTNCR